MKTARSSITMKPGPPLPGAARITIATMLPGHASLRRTGDGGANVHGAGLWLGWPMQGDFYWSSLAGITGQHHAADVSNRGETQKPDRYDVHRELRG